MWHAENRARYERRGLRYPSDLTDEEWAVLAPLIPRAKRGGNRRHVDERSLVDGLLYILRVCPGTFLFLTELSEHEANGCQPQEC
jgi:transposase